MKIFVTGASGFVGSAVVKELMRAGHEVIGLARSEKSAEEIVKAGGSVLQGSLDDLDVLRQGAAAADGVIHTAFIHDFTQYEKANEADKVAIGAMGEAIKGTSKPIVVTAGILGAPQTDGFVTEDDIALNSPRGSEAAAMSLAESGVNASVVRLSPLVHDAGDKGFAPFIIGQARKNGASAYAGDGGNRWSAVHRLDAARLFRLALEKGAKGAIYNGVAEEAIKIKQIAELIGEKLNLPLKSLSADEVPQHFEWMSFFIGFDSPASSRKTQERLGWKPQEISLFDDMEKNYF